MQRLALFIGALAIALAGGLAYLGANLMVDYVERATTQKIDDALQLEGIDWVSVRADGLRLVVSGPAPDEASRFKTLSIAKSLISAARVVDLIKVVNPDDLRAPKFSLELLRNDDGISLIGLIPESMGRSYVLDSIGSEHDKASVTDMLETADYAQPEGWKAAVDFALASLRELPRSKISVTALKVEITAITDSREEKQAIEAQLEKDRPGKTTLVLRINAPRPVITPFSLRLIKDELGTRFDSCSGDNAATVSKILSAARAIGLEGAGQCAIGLGAPSPRWGDAVEVAIKALGELGGGGLTFSDADITLVAPDTLAKADFDRIIYDLEQALPDVFSVRAVLPPKPVVEGQKAAVEVKEFLATKSPENLVQLRGRLRDERTKTSVNIFAKSLFGGENVNDTTRLDPSLPDGWPLRVLAGLEALDLLRNGVLVVHPDMLTLRGIADRPEAKTEITQLLSTKIGDAARYKISVTYDEALNKTVVPPTPQECVDRINAILAQGQITFAPSSTSIDIAGIKVVEKIAEAMTDCTDVPMEIGGYTDSQGRETMNQTLSQSRAESVLDMLLSLEVLTTNLSAKGYGEAQPIADNKTEEGRKANRRIAFRLVGADAAPVDGAQQAADGTVDGAAADPAHKDEAAPTGKTKKDAKHGQN
ncbi:MAG: OmpA family protein [Alphaproteobacteria bacterium]|nr:OmpA family protein [Alphaproteobacteria bacterium]